MMQEKDSIERFIQGLKKAASAARELTKIMKYPMWDQIAISMDGIRQKGELMIRGKALTRQEVLRKIEDIRVDMIKKSGEEVH